VRRTIKDVENKKDAELDSPDSLDQDSSLSVREKWAKRLFPKVKNVSIAVLGKRYPVIGAGYSMDQTHVGPTTNPHDYIEASRLT